MTHWRNSKSKKIREHLKENPDAICRDVSDKFDCSHALVSKIRSEMRVNVENKGTRELAAIARGITVLQLDAAILKVVYSDDMIDAILDDME